MPGFRLSRPEDSLYSQYRGANYQARTDTRLLACVFGRDLVQLTNYSIVY